MPLIPDDEKLRLKREISVQRLAEARGIKLKRHGKELIGLCPFHQDTSPSLNIDPAKNEWHCKGACREGGDVIKWVMRAEGVSFTHAIAILRRDHLPLTAAAGGPPPKQSTVRKLPPLIEHTNDDKKLLEIVVNHYHQTLKQSPEAQQYLEKRGLKSAAMVEHFRLGYANRTLGYHLPASNRKPGEEQRGRLKQLGVLRNQTPGHEHFRGSLVIPIFDLAGDVVQMYGRKIRDDLREGTPDHLYLPGPHRGVWNEQALMASKEIIVCEALIDALTFWCAGFRHVTTIYGVNGFTDELRQAFKKYGTKRIYLAYDRDEAGERAAREHSEELMQMGIECFRVQFPKGQDANECALKTTPAAKTLGIFLNSAAWLGKGKPPVGRIAERPKPTTPAAPNNIDERLEEQPAAPKVEMKPDDQPAPIPEPDPKPAAKEENAIALPTQSLAENVLPLAADDEVPRVALPSLAASDPEMEVRGEDIFIRFATREYRIRGLKKNTSSEVLKVNVFVSGENLRGEFVYFGDTLDLNPARQRGAFIKQAAQEMGVKEEIIQRETGKLWMLLQDMQRRQIEQALEKPEAEIVMTAEEEAAAMELLRDPRLLDRILADFEKCGVVGEETNKKIGYLAAVSRLLDAPLAVVVQSSSAAGKSSLMEAVLAFMPEDQHVEYSAMTGQALFYMGENELKHKILAVVEEEGAQRAAYALKLLQSEGSLSIASTGKDPNNGRLITHHYRVEGPVMIFLTTTAIDVDEELLNRCLVLTVNEDREQTQAIHRIQRYSQTREGVWARKKRAQVLRLHRNAQRLLRPLTVVNEHVRDLAFPDSMTRTRRDHVKLLTLINAIALLHQHQRPVQTDTRDGETLEYIEATEADVELAKQLANHVLVRSLDDLQPQTKRLLLLIEEMVNRACDEQQIERGEYRFTRRTVRRYTRWGDSALKKHLSRLEELEYLIVHRGGRGQSFVYELYFETDEHGNPVIPGLALSYDEKKSRPEGGLAPSSHGQVTGVARGGHDEESPALARRNDGNGHAHAKNAIQEAAPKNPAVAKPNGASKANGHALAKRAGVK